MTLKHSKFEIYNLTEFQLLTQGKDSKEKNFRHATSKID